VKKRAKIADEITLASDGKLSLITDYFLKNSSDPILVNIVSGAQKGQAVLFSSHGKAISQKSYTKMAQCILAEKPFVKAAVFATLNDAVSARNRLLK
jgi:hypothetical protein